MDRNEIIALSIVVLAVFLALRYFLNRKNGGCCSSGCFSPDKSKFTQKEKTSKPQDKK